MKILIADDNSGTRSALGLLIEQQQDMRVVGEAGDAEGLAETLRETQPDIVLLDWELPGLQRMADPETFGQTALADLRALMPQLKVIVLSGRPEVVRDALAAGADAFVSKGESPNGLKSILKAFGEGARERVSQTTD